MRAVLKLGIVGVLCTLFLSACKLPGDYEVVKSPPVTNKGMCVFPEPADFKHNCQLSYWLNFWSENGAKPWPERQKMIQELGESKQATFIKVLLSLNPGTPYQSRLRAQNWATALLPKMTRKMAAYFRNTVLPTNQQLLELESAVTVLSRLNAEHNDKLERQQALIDAQRVKMEKLMKIEASMVPKRDSDN